MAASPDNLLVRWATRWDRAAVTALMARLAAEHDVPTRQEDLEEAFEYALRNPDLARFCVAERDRQILGVAGLHRAYSTWRARHFGTVEDMYVVEEARREGVGSALLRFLLEQARRRDYCMVSLHVRAHNGAARTFYERLGLCDTGYVVYEMQTAAEGKEAEPA